VTAEETKKWKRFEQKAFEIQKSISPAHAEVKSDDSIPGVDSKTNRQIDISIRTVVGSYPILIIVECKDYKTPVDVTAVEGFISVMRDVRANKGVMVAAKGFTDAAKTLAAHHNIDLLQLIDTESVDWGADVSVPGLLERTYIEAYSVAFRNFIEIPIEPTKQIALELATASGEKLGTIQSILASEMGESRNSTFTRHAQSYDRNESPKRIRRRQTNPGCGGVCRSKTGVLFRSHTYSL
jgi:hypothetical protein